jgi:hypothetical protein
MIDSSAISGSDLRGSRFYLTGFSDGMFVTEPASLLTGFL